ncbi:MAG: S1C family serine protease [Candidatus Poribacteria bacterium]|nr:S1C family serine protease [Candidatus Poribacteria bacterium]
MPAWCHYSFILLVWIFLFSQPLSAETLRLRVPTLQQLEQESQQIIELVRPLVVKVVASRSLLADRLSPLDRSNATNVAIDQLTEIKILENIGSGIVLDTVAGHIVTTDEVIQYSEKIEVITDTGRRQPAQLVAVDPMTGIAVISTTLETDQTIAGNIGSGTDIQAGAWLFMVGVSYGTSPVFAFGIASGLESLPRLPTYDGIKINAAISPGNIGGAVVNTEGQIVGMIRATLGPRQITGTSMFRSNHLTFALPMVTVSEIANQLISQGRVLRGWLGIKLDQRPQGITVTQVLTDSPADQAGLLPDDVILRFNRDSVSTFSEIQKRVRGTPPGTTVRLTVNRAGQILSRFVTLGEYQSGHLTGEYQD